MLLTSLNRHGLTGPLITVCVGVVALILLHDGGDTKLVVDEGSLGPWSWPRVMLFGVIASGLIWGASRWHLAKKIANDDQSEIRHDSVKLVGGILAVVLYGAAMVYIGFAIATFFFLVTWFLLGGLRKPLPLIANSVLGTLALLFLFLKVAYLPLPRGVGFMDKLTVTLYQFLGIF